MDFTQDQLGLIGIVVIILALFFSFLRGASAIMNILSILAGAGVATFLYTTDLGYVDQLIGDSTPLHRFIAAAIGGVIIFFFARFIGVLFFARVLKMLFGSKFKKLIPIIALLLGGCFVKQTIKTKSEEDSLRPRVESLRQEPIKETAQKVLTAGDLSKFKDNGLFEIRYFFSNLLYEAKGKVLELTGHKRSNILLDNEHRYDVIKLAGILVDVDEQSVAIEYQRVIRSEGVQNLLHDRRIVRALVRKDYETLYRNPKVSAYIRDPRNKALLDAIKW